MSKLSLMGSLGNLSPQTAIAGIHSATDDVLGDINETFGGRRVSMRSCHNKNVLSGLGNDYLNGIGGENELDGEDDYISGIEEIEEEGIGKKSKAQKQQKKADKKEKKAVRKTTRKAKKTTRQVKRAAKKTPQAKAAKKEKRKKIFKGVKKVGFAPARGAFLALIALGGALAKTPLKLNLASKLAKSWQIDNGAKVSKVWESFGGKRDALAKAISKAAKVQISGNGTTADDVYYSDNSFISGLGSAVGVAATIAAAAPITIAMMRLFKGDAVVTEAEAEFVEDVTDAIEDDALEKSGGNVKKVLATAASTQLVKEGAKLDNGGNIETQRDIVKEANEEPEHVEGDSSNFEETEEGEENFNKAAVKKSGNAAAIKTSTAPNNTQNETPNLPATKEQYAPIAKSVAGNYKAPITWVKALVLAICLCDIYHVKPVLASFIGNTIFIVLVISLLNLSIKKIPHGKIRF